ncbi:hypothetical protein QYE76_032873 [Lolium multiflorum]|uniref:TF-B3 domain-containing protein n=1 Tax=Lolium multiflorum TaxID=4521 RepID=A0AAD8VLK6_LOLMU|nr:hypothetical protein QYE76_032873 [Lolium multiflorum]
MDEEGSVLFEFVLVLKGDPRSIQRLPDTFADYVAGDERPHTLHLREDSCGYYRWIVDVIYDARGKMYLHIGWEKFARHHSLQAGFVLVFSYFGDRDMSVKVFDETCCRRNYHVDGRGGRRRVLFLRSEYRHGGLCLFSLERTNRNTLASWIIQFG